MDVPGVNLQARVLMLLVQHATFYLMLVLIVEIITIVILAKMLVVFGAKMVNVEEREIPFNALKFLLETATLIVHTSLTASVAMLFLVATGVMIFLYVLILTNPLATLP